MVLYCRVSEAFRRVTFGGRRALMFLGEEPVK
jgi:hypothetical protein